LIWAQIASTIVLLFQGQVANEPVSLGDDPLRGPT
jgi:hypothetical protein